MRFGSLGWIVLNFYLLPIEIVLLEKYLKYIKSINSENKIRNSNKFINKNQTVYITILTIFGIIFVIFLLIVYFKSTYLLYLGINKITFINRLGR